MNRPKKTVNDPEAVEEGVGPRHILWPDALHHPTLDDASAQASADEVAALVPGDRGQRHQGDHQPDRCERVRLCGEHPRGEQQRVPGKDHTEQQPGLDEDQHAQADQATGGHEGLDVERIHQAPQ